MTRAIVATHSGLYDVELKSTSAPTVCKRLAHGYHYGIWVESPDRFWVYRGGDNVHQQTDRNLLAYDRTDDVWSAADDCISLPESVDAVHQIVLLTSGQFLVANTLYNELVWIDRSGEVAARLRFDESNEDRNHVNSVVEIGDGLGLAMLHNLRHRESQLSLLDVRSSVEIDRMSLPDIQCHNIGIAGDRLVYNGSGRRNLTAIGLTTGRRLANIRFSEHPKGLASDGSTLFVGSSNYASRSERGRSAGWITALDAVTFDKLWTSQLHVASEGPEIGNVNEIRLVQPVDAFGASLSFTGAQARALFAHGMNQPELQLRRLAIRLSDRAKRSVRSVRSA